MMSQPQKQMSGPDERLEMAFSVRGNRRLQLRVDAPAEKVSRFFSHQLIREPRDLLSHVQRIHFLIRQTETQAVYSALLDLFLALGARGQSLREEMLNHAMALLSTAQQQYLKSKLETGIGARDIIPDPGQSILCKGFTGNSDLVLEVRPQTALDNQPLQQALECLECSDLNGARLILEEAMLGDQSSLEQQQLLLEIYRKADDKEHFIDLHQKLDGHGVEAEAEAEWQSLLQHFQQAS